MTNTKLTKGSNVALTVSRYSATTGRTLKVGHVGTVLAFGPTGDILVKFKQIAWPCACGSSELVAL